jgi:hypothetical protein
MPEDSNFNYLAGERKGSKFQCSETKDMKFLSLFTNINGQDNTHSYFIQSESEIVVPLSWCPRGFERLGH